MHCDVARAEQRAVLAIQSPTISLDIDEPRQVNELLDFCQLHPEFRKTRTWKFLNNTKGIALKTQST